MGGLYNPTPQEQSLLNQIKANESGGNYGVTISPQTCQLLNGPGAVCTASGAYQFINATWNATAAATGVGTNCPTAASCDPASQDINALYLLRTQGTTPWGGAAKYGSVSDPSTGDPLVDVSGDAASTPTSSIMDSLTTQAASVGIDLTDPTTGFIVAAAAIAAVFLVGRRL